MYKRHVAVFRVVIWAEHRHNFPADKDAAVFDSLVVIPHQERYNPLLSDAAKSQKTAQPEGSEHECHSQ